MEHQDGRDNLKAMNEIHGTNPEPDTSEEYTNPRYAGFWRGREIKFRFYIWFFGLIALIILIAVTSCNNWSCEITHGPYIPLSSTSTPLPTDAAEDVSSLYGAK